MAHSGLFDGKIVVKNDKNVDKETVEFINNLANLALVDVGVTVLVAPQWGL